MALEDILQQRYTDLLTGKLKAYELPEFQSMRTILEQVGAKSRAATAKEMRRAGISGPSVGLTMAQQEKSQLAPLGTAMGGYMGGLSKEAAGWGTQQKGLDIQRELGLAQLAEQKKARRFAEKQARMGAVGGMDKCVLTTACYGPDSLEVQWVRRLRDAMKHIPSARTIIRGYYVFSDLVFPLFRFEIVRRAFKGGILKPMFRMILRKLGMRVRPWLTGLDQIISYLTLSLWKLMGSRGIYTRRNGERV